MKPDDLLSQGPDGTNGFAAGWTTRVSQYAPPPEDISDDTTEETQDQAAPQGKADEVVPSDGNDVSGDENKETASSPQE